MAWNQVQTRGDQEKQNFKHFKRRNNHEKEEDKFNSKLGLTTKWRMTTPLKGMLCRAIFIKNYNPMGMTRLTINDRKGLG